MEEEKERIVNYAEEKFFREGFYKTTMDELAGALQMSKKTIYKFFSSKEMLVEAVAVRFREAVAARMTGILEADENAIVKMVRLTSLIGHLALKINEKMMRDLQRHLPRVWAGIDEFRTKMMNKNFKKLIDQGKREGLIVDLPTEVLITILVSSVRGVVNPEFIMHNKFSFKQAMDITFEVLMNGMLTEKGREIYKQSKSRIRNEK